MFFKEILLIHKPYTLHTLTREIQRQSGITFSYDALKIDPNRKIKLKPGQDRLTVKELLAVLKKKTGIGYKIVSSSHIIYTGSGERKKTARITKSKPPKLKKQRNIAPAADDEPDEPDEPEVMALREDSTFQQQIIVVGDSTLAVGYYLAGGGGSGGAYGGNNDQKYPVREIEEEEGGQESNGQAQGRGGAYGGRGQSEVINFIKSSSLAAGGLTADETYYLNPTLRAGFTFLYGTVAYNIGPFPHWRYGIGTSARISERWWGHIEFNTGNTVSRNYNLQFFDTTEINPNDSFQNPVITERNVPLRVQSKLTRVTLGIDWDMGSGFFLGGGLTFNHLRTTYYSNGNQVALSDVLPIGYDADLKYRTIAPPYLFSNTYSGNEPSNTKIWIGLQLRLIYRLNFFER